nr:MAG TPA: upper collar protein [Caudoviricetes sp.]
MWFNSFFPFYTVPVGSAKKLARYENDMEFQNTFFHYFNLAISTFKWDGLPETCNARYLETCLMLDGIAAFCKDPEMGYLTLKVSPVAQAYNLYGETDKIYGYGWNGFMREYTAYMYGSDNTMAQAVVCRDNPVCYPCVNHLLLYANRLTSTMRSLDVAAKKLKVPYYITCDESQKSSVEKILNDVDDNKERIIVNRSTMDNVFQVLPTRIDPSLLSVFWEHYENLEGQLKGLFGIESAVNQDKKERLITDEVNANNASTALSLQVRLAQRQQLCDTINKMWGLNVSVSLGDYYAGSDEWLEDPEPLNTPSNKPIDYIE